MESCPTLVFRFSQNPRVQEVRVLSEAAAFLERKIALYPATGSHAVWVAYPESRKVRTHLAEGIARLLREDRYLVSRFLEGI